MNSEQETVKTTGVIARLPEHVANQIAAGEVIQRPASVVKELVENAVDAGGRRIEVIVKDAGRTLIQVVDDGVGMREADAQLCFERHATSKLKSADDLFWIGTKGFRGEALASIAAIAHVELRTRQRDEELGIRMRVEGSVAGTPELDPSVKPGTSFSVKNLFYNVPARRNFLKSDAVELRHIIDEFTRVALAHHNISFRLMHNGSVVFDLSPGSRRQRIVAVFGPKYDERLVPVEEETDAVHIAGFVGKPQFARKSRGEQFLFVNNRFIRHGLLHKAIMNAYDGLLDGKHHPLYVLFLEVDPCKVDVNIHPTKVEVKFEEDRVIFSMLKPAVRRGLGRHAVAPALEFDQETSLNISEQPPVEGVRAPKVAVNKDYNPFHKPTRQPSSSAKGVWTTALQQAAEDAHGAWSTGGGVKSESSPSEGQSTISRVSGGFDAIEPETQPVAIQVEERRPVMNWSNKYIVTSLPSGLFVIHAHRAHTRVLFEAYVQKLDNGVRPVSIQQLLFPEFVELPNGDRAVCEESRSVLAHFGLEFQMADGGIEVTGVPSGVQDEPAALVEAILEDGLEPPDQVTREELVAARLARMMAYKSGRRLTVEEMTDLVDALFGCSEPGLDPFGRPVIATFDEQEILKKLH
ncbi:MAG: DNA mismatch repair endonuclease MutL [Flavobacteriales bacterium]